MIDLTTRGRGRQPGTPEPRTANELIQARIDGWLSRRELVRRATMLGFGAPVIGVMLHATSDLVRGAPNPAGGARTTRFQDATTVPATEPTKPSGTPQTGGTLTISTTEEPDTLHPWLTVLVSTGNILSGMMDSLLTYDSRQQLQPALAEGFAVADDGLSYTFTLRQGVTFHNGDPFTGQDVIDSWRMIMNPDFAAIQLAGWQEIADITMPDPTTLVITTRETYAPFLATVAAGSASSYICPSREIAKGIDAFKQEFGRAPIGTGPYKFVEWKTKEQVTMEKFPGYWGNAPKLDRLFYRTLPDDSTILVQLDTGETQLADGVSASRVDQALGIDRVSVLEFPGMDWSHLDLKNIGFLRETKVRQALDFATPSQLIVDELLKGRAIRAVADQAPGTWAYNPNIEPRPYDLDQARALLDEVGLTVGDDDIRERDGTRFDLEIWGIAGDAQQQQIVQVIAQSWEQVGIGVTTGFQDTSTLWGPEGYQWNEKMTACLYSWFNGNDPDDSIYWHSSQIPDSPTGSGYNATAYFHEYNFQAEIDDLTSRAAKETDQEARKQLYWQIQELLHREVPVIFISWGKGFTPATKNLGGFWPSAYNYLLWNVQDWYLTE